MGKEKVMSESKEEEKSYLSKILFHSNSVFPQDFQKILDSHKKVHERGSALKPDVMDSTQRPILSQLQELYHGIAEDGTTPGSSGESPKKPKSRKSKMGKMKEKAWMMKIDTGSPGKKPAAKRPLEDVEVEEDEPP